MDIKEQEKNCAEWIKKSEKTASMAARSKELKPLSLRDDEVFVPFYDYRYKKFDKRFCVSNYGTFVSFANHNNGYLPTVKQAKKRKTAYSYVNLRENDRLSIHRVVWFAFFVDYLINGTAYKDLDFHGLGILNIDDLNMINTSDIEIHHKIEPPEDHYIKDNSLRNLQGLPYAFHDLFTIGERKKDPEDRKAFFLEQEDAIQEYALSNERLIFEVSGDHIYINSAIKFSNVDDIVWDTPLTPMNEEDKKISRDIDIAVNTQKSTKYLDTAKRIVICGGIQDIAKPENCRQWDMTREKRGIKIHEVPKNSPVCLNADILYNTSTKMVQFISKEKI